MRLMIDSGKLIQLLKTLQDSGAESISFDTIEKFIKESVEFDLDQIIEDLRKHKARIPAECTPDAYQYINERNRFIEILISALENVQIVNGKEAEEYFQREAEAAQEETNENEIEKLQQIAQQLNNMSDEDVAEFFEEARDTGYIDDMKISSIAAAGAIDRDYLSDWYIHSVDADSEPRWSEEHLDELYKDFSLLPRSDSDAVPNVKIHIKKAKVETTKDRHTNADRIRKMTDIQLKNLLEAAEEAGYNDSSITPKGANGYHIDMMRWLQMEVDD